MAITTPPLSPKVRSLIKTYDSEHERSELLAQFDMEEMGAIHLPPVRIVVAKWVRTSAGSIVMAEQTKKEDRFQSKVGLILAIGDLAFVDDDRHDWAGFKPKVGDWVLYHFSDGNDFDYSPKGTFDRLPCKMISEGDVQAILPRPDFAY